MFSLLPLLLLITPVFVGVLCLFVHPFPFLAPLYARVEKFVLMFGAGLTLIIALSMLPDVLAGHVLETPMLSIHADLTNIAAVVGVTLISFLVSVYNAMAEKGGHLRPHLYNFFVLLFIFCMLGLILVYDLFGVFLFVETTIGVAIILVAHAPGKLSPEAAFKYLIITAISALFVLLGVMIVYTLSGTSSLFTIVDAPGRLIENPRLLMLAVACFVVGLGADIGLVPFHGWVPDVWPASTPIVNGFSCAEPLALIFGLYKLTSPLYTVYPSTTIILLMVGVGLISVVWGVLLAYRQTEFWRMIAYLTIEEFGNTVLVLGLFTPESFVAGQMLLVNAALMKAGVVLSLGSVNIHSGTSDIGLLGGLAERMAKTVWGYIICALSLAGLPPLSGFYAKWFFYGAVYNFLSTRAGLIPSVLATVLLAFTSMIPLIILIRAFHNIFLGQPSKVSENVREAPLAMWLPSLAFASAAILLGLQPSLLTGLIRPP